MITISAVWENTLYLLLVLGNLNWSCWGLTTCQPLWVILSSSREREKRYRKDSRGDERDGQGRKRSRNEKKHLTLYHICPKFWKTSLLYYMLTCLNSTLWVENNVDLDKMPHSEVSDLGLHICSSLSVPIIFRVIMVPSDVCAQWGLKSAYASVHSLIIIGCLHEETLHPWLSKMRPVKILIRLR